MVTNDTEHTTFLDGMLVVRGQGQKGKDFSNPHYPPWWTESECIFYEYYDSPIGDREMSMCRAPPENKKLFWEMVTEYHDYHQRRHQIEMTKKMTSKKVHAGHELGAREFTLTYSPKWFDDAEARVRMRKAINRLIKYYKDEIVQLRAIGEVGKNGLSHVHCFYKILGGKKMTDKNFVRAYPKWNPKKVTGRGYNAGHEGGHHAVVRLESDFLGYIDKDVENAWLDITFPQDNINASEADEDPEA